MSILLRVRVVMRPEITYFDNERGPRSRPEVAWAEEYLLILAPTPTVCSRVLAIGVGGLSGGQLGIRIPWQKPLVTMAHGRQSKG